MENKTNFGFKIVDSINKSHLVQAIFSAVAPKYDLMNDLMSAGIHRLWKNTMINHLNFTQHKNILDLASGTGDIALKITKQAQKISAQNFSINFSITLSDLNPEMLQIAKAKAIDGNLFRHLDFVVANGENLPFADDSFDAVTVAFGLRNFTNLGLGLSEIYRVLKPQGKFICLEFSKINDLWLQKLYDLYSFKIIPKIGGLVLNDVDSYQYLVESIRVFPDQENFLQLINQAGFVNSGYQNLSCGVACLHYGYKN
ncbi:MAG: bifunctional demethylmenaquinone methyltransferase/2-methoxy-6-polyprenyl-1,4-benzoquinol methylase UbiE [Proteobacteria bacterium]|jgi:demethylmenaquinone methyltransferase/2-methoxy-6-polyprenyl-1,4-benzoquinol methylase|nr:bifunctional demethylmenaquinone methyltransferase/2-methoxy-6-polyprenyl-1,4-benzoquinol methylase UbiE [Pseudomonadota bacterium]